MKHLQRIQFLRRMAAKKGNNAMTEEKPLPKWRLWIKAHKTALTATTTALIAYLAGDGTIHTLWQAFLSMFGF